MWHDVLFYGGLTFLVLLAGAVFVIIFSLLQLAQKEDYLEDYEDLVQAAAASQGLPDPAHPGPAVDGGSLVPGGLPRLEGVQARSKG